MYNERMMRLIVLVAILVGACGKKEGGDKPADNAVEQYTEEKAIALMGKIVDIYDASGEDCAKLAADLKAFTAKNKAELMVQTEWKTKLTPEQRDALDTKYRTELQLSKKMGPAAQACGDDPGLQAALRELDRVFQ